MTKTIPPARRIQLLLNTLAGERYVRRSLLGELIDELVGANDRPDAVKAGLALIERLESSIDEGEYERWIARIVELTTPAHLGNAPCAEAAE